MCGDASSFQRESGSSTPFADDDECRQAAIALMSHSSTILWLQEVPTGDERYSYRLETQATFVTYTRHLNRTVYFFWPKTFHVLVSLSFSRGPKTEVGRQVKVILIGSLDSLNTKGGGSIEFCPKEL